MLSIIREIKINLKEALSKLNLLRINRKKYNEDYEYFRAAKTELQCVIDVVDLKELRDIRLDLKSVRGNLKYIADDIVFNDKSYDTFIFAYQLIDKSIEEIEYYFEELKNKEIA